MQAFNINKAEAQKILQIKSEAEYRICFFGDMAWKDGFNRERNNRWKLCQGRYNLSWEEGERTDECILFNCRFKNILCSQTENISYMAITCLR